MCIFMEIKYDFKQNKINIELNKNIVLLQCPIKNLNINYN